MDKMENNAHQPLLNQAESVQDLTHPQPIVISAREEDIEKYEKAVQKSKILIFIVVITTILYFGLALFALKIEEYVGEYVKKSCRGLTNDFKHISKIFLVFILGFFVFSFVFLSLFSAFLGIWHILKTLAHTRETYMLRCARDDPSVSTIWIGRYWKAFLSKFHVYKLRDFDQDLVDLDQVFMVLVSSFKIMFQVLTMSFATYLIGVFDRNSTLDNQISQECRGNWIETYLWAGISLFDDVFSHIFIMAFLFVVIYTAYFFNSTIARFSH